MKKSPVQIHRQSRQTYSTDIRVGIVKILVLNIFVYLVEITYITFKNLLKFIKLMIKDHT